MKTTLLALALFASVAAADNDGTAAGWLIRLLPSSWVSAYFRPPDINSLPDDALSREIKYGHDLINRTAYYLGPKGTVGRNLGNRMNCKSCHLDGGQRMFGGSFMTTFTRYPQFRERENRVVTLEDRINLCIVRPQSGKPLPHDSREMRAMTAYMKWLATGKRTDARELGDTLLELPLISRAADPERGRQVYTKHCQTCHGVNGEGVLDGEGVAFIYPPLWGPESFSIGSTMHRVRPAAAFIKANMPFGTTWDKPVLTDEEAYDVAAFINDGKIHERPIVDVSQDYPDLLTKPADYPYAPYADDFTEQEHRFGPFQPILTARKKLKKGQ